MSRIWKVKKWQYAAVVADEALVTMAVVDLGYLGYGFAYAYHRETHELREFKTFIPLAAGVHVPDSPDLGEARLKFGHSALSFDISTGTWNMDLPDFRLELRFRPGQPWNARWEVPGGGVHQTRKTLGAPADGTLRLASTDIAIKGTMLIDWSRGQLARETQWRWACGTGHAGGQAVAWNLRTGFGDPLELESAIWIDGVPQAVGRSKIEPGEHWVVESGDLELTFEGDGKHEEDLNVGLLASRYVQPWGRFTGTWKGEPLTGYGVVEDHWAKW